MAKKVKMNPNLKGIKVTTPTFRVSYPKLFKAEKYQGKEDAKPKFSLVMIFDEKTDLTAIKKAVVQAKREAFGKDKTKWPKVSTPWRDGNENQNDSGDVAEGYEDTTYATANTYNKPLIINREKEKIEDEAEVYPGCYGQAALCVKIAESGGKYFAVFYLQGFRKMKDGDPLGGGASADDFSDDDSDSDEDEDTDSDNDDSDSDEDEDDDSDNDSEDDDD